MPIVSVAENNPFVDGRQSQRALQIRTGVERHFGKQNWATLPELTLRSGRRADVVAISPKGEIWIVEIKSSIADMKADKKWIEYQDYCDSLIFATLPDVPREIFPPDAGFMVADNHGAELLRQPLEMRLNAARRKVMHLQFARASAMRLATCCAHAGFDAAHFDENG